jgi:hypothetical protein
MNSSGSISDPRPPSAHSFRRHSRRSASDPKPLSTSFKLRKRRSRGGRHTTKRRPKKSNK